MPEYWMITNRAIKGAKLTGERSKLSYFISDSDRLDVLRNWREISADKFRSALRAAADRFPSLPEERQQQQKHLTIFIHGYNTSFDDALRRAGQISYDLRFGGATYVFSWPASNNYFADYDTARKSIDNFHDFLVRIVQQCVDRPRRVEKATP